MATHRQNDCALNHSILVQRVLAREDDAERHFHIQFTPLIRRIAAKYTAGGWNLEVDDLINLAFAFLIVGIRQTSSGDLTQHTPRLQIWSNDPKGHLAGYIATCVNNYFCDLVRQSTHIKVESLSEQSVEAQANDYPDLQAGAEDERLLRQEQINSVRAVWAQLSLPERELLDMKYHRDMSDAAVSKQLGISEATARRHRINAEAHFQELYEERVSA